MFRIQVLYTARFAAALFFVTTFLTPAYGQSGLKTITNPGGGRIIYGPLTGQASLQAAMITMLRNVRNHFGERPEIGKFYKARGTDSAATFFSLTTKSPAGKRIRGMVIVSLAQSNMVQSNNDVDAAVLYDDADRFPSTWSMMMGKLNQAWHQDFPKPVRASKAGGDSLPRQPVQRLRPTAFPDGSGTIGLPEGWRITASSHGAVWASGPNGESVALAAIWQMYDPSNQYITSNGRRPLPAGSAISPCCDLLRAWLASAQPSPSKGGSSPLFRTISSSRMQPSQGALDAVLVTGELDYHDGIGPLLTKLQLSRIGGGPGSGTWGMMVFRLSVPVRLAEQEGPTLAAIGRSLSQNGKAIQQQADFETNAINVTAENGRRIQAQKNESNYQRNREIESSWNEQAKRNQAFDNYLLDQTVVQNSQTGAHGTTGYATANWLVTQFPNQFQYVPTAGFVKDTDY